MAAIAIIRTIPNTRNPWVATVNGKTYSYEAGTEQEVPEEIAHLIDQEMEHLQPKYPQPESDGGGGTFKVYLSTDEDGDKVDKTFEEIAEAVENDMDVRLVGKYEGYVAVYPMASYDAGNLIKFSSFCHIGSSMAELTTFYVSSDGTVTSYYSEIELGNSGEPN